MSFELVGKIIEIAGVQVISDKFRKREFIVEYRDNPGGSYVQYLKFQCTGDKCSLLDSFKVGQEVNISFNLKGRRYEKDGRVSYFMDLEAWRIGNPNGAGQTNNDLPSFGNLANLEEEDENGGLPF